MHQLRMLVPAMVAGVLGGAAVLTASVGKPDVAAAGDDSVVTVAVLRSPISDVPFSDQLRPQSEALTSTINIQATPGEFEPGSFVLTAGARRVDGIRLVASDLVGEQGVISSDAVNLRLVKVWFQAGTAWTDIRYSKYPRRLVPEMLVNDDGIVDVDYAKRTNLVRLSTPEGPRYVDVESQADSSKRILLDAKAFPLRDAEKLQPFTLAGGKIKQVWVTMRVPDDVAAGFYKGEISVFAEDARVAAVPLVVRVLPFRLKEPMIEYSIYYRGVLTDGAATISSEDKTERQMCIELRNMVDHGISNPTVYQFAKDQLALDRVLRLRSSCGITARTLYYLGYFVDPRSVDAQPGVVRDRLRGVIATAKVNGLEQAYFYGLDEAVGPDLVRQLDAWSFVRRQGGLVYVAGKTGTADIVGGKLDLLVAAGVPDRAEAARYRAAGTRIFSYANPQVGVENPLVFRVNYGLLLWQRDYDGAMPYAYQHSEGSAWNDFDGRYRDHMFAYPTADGVIDTLAWEGFREGVDDVRYLTTLRDQIDARKSCAAAQAPSEEAKAYMKELKARTLGNLDEERSAIVDLLVRLLAVPCGN